jgi:hypothetical protein
MASSDEPVLLLMEVPALSCIAARRLVGHEARMPDETPYGLSWKLIERSAALPELREKLVSHAARPETFDVILDSNYGVFARLGTKEIADIVRHLHEMLGGAHRAIIAALPLVCPSRKPRMRIPEF